VLLHDGEVARLDLEHVEVADEARTLVELAAGRRHPGEVAAVAEVVVGEGVPFDEADHEEPRVGDVLEHRGAHPRLCRCHGVEVLGLAVDREQLAALLPDAYDDRAFGRGHLEVHVGEAPGKLLDLALATAQALDRVQRC
jgi:hypothetical protein